MNQTPPPRPGLGPLVQPAPCSVNVGQFRPHGSDETLVAVTAETVTGTHTFMLPPDIAEQLGHAIVENARNARTGLIVPQSPLDIRHSPNGQS
ncbi:MAG: hypothetical protein MUF33_02205 [Candidatus Nanopelagicales bacterium]|jgi:hypothetical protein|nr:hypothetical protein [Candidatus Nanopelagicales bacterium]